MGDVTRIIIHPMMSLFGPLPSGDSDTVLDIYERILGDYSNDTLTKAFDRVCNEFVPSRRMAWPAPAMIKKHCQDIVGTHGQPQKKYHFPSKMGPYDPATVAQWERAAAWRASLPDNHPLVRQAAPLSKAIIDISRPAFEKMMRESPNQGLYRIRGGKLTEASRKMAGERDE